MVTEKTIGKLQDAIVAADEKEIVQLKQVSGGEVFICTFSGDGSLLQYCVLIDEDGCFDCFRRDDKIFNINETLSRIVIESRMRKFLETYYEYSEICDSKILIFEDWLEKRGLEYEQEYEQESGYEPEM